MSKEADELYDDQLMWLYAEDTQYGGIIFFDKQHDQIEPPPGLKALTFPGTCLKCGRKSWQATILYDICGMKQPDGSICDGVFGYGG